MVEINLKNGTLITITANGNAGIKKRELVGGDDVDGFNFFGRFKKNKPTAIASITAEAPKDGLEYTHRFVKGPKLILNSFNKNRLMRNKLLLVL